MENKSNIAPFYPGQKVVCVRSNNGLKGKVFTVHSCYRSECGCWRINVSEVNETYIEAERLNCDYCGKITRAGVNRASAPAVYFRPLEQKPFPLIKLSQIKEQELCAN